MAKRRGLQFVTGVTMQLTVENTEPRPEACGDVASSARSSPGREHPLNEVLRV